MDDLSEIHTRFLQFESKVYEIQGLHGVNTDNEAMQIVFR
jgi:hypothetical protein